ncbi:MAG TPA: pentapeptide repeat-containing protein [Saprospiraceae bacterium]|nr:pentapeptide repeat-containing protein [Saprospiraceae bacterium]
MKENRTLLTGVLLITIMMVALVTLFHKNKLLNTRVLNQQLHIDQQAELIDSLRRTDLVQMMSNVMDRTEDELQQNPKRILSDERIASIAALCYLFKPYTYHVGDSISDKKLSPERGQLLLMLSAMRIDSGSFHKIMLKSSFAHAVLRNADLREADLRWADLEGADLQDANLEGANLSETNLKMVNLWGANLMNSKLNEALLKRADLRWAVLNDADLRKADLNEADLTSAQLRRADLSGAVLRWVDFSGAFLNEANLSGTDLFRASFIKAHLEKSILTDANLTLANLSDASLTETDLTDADMTSVVVSAPDWLNRLQEWTVKGAKEIQGKYKLIDESSKVLPYFRMVKIKG